MQRQTLGTSLLACALLLLGTISNVSAQQFTGGIRGAVRDANGVIPGVEVTLTNDDTGVARNSFTNEVGEYNFPAVTPGPYTLRAVLQGFRTYERSGLRIGTQQFLTIDVLMEVGSIQEEIQVTAAAPLIETSNASGGAALDREILENLPAPGRNAFLIAVTIPTVNPVGDPQFNRQQDQSNASRISLGGGGVRANNYLIDGVPVTELVGRAVLNPTIEAVDEVKVQIHTYDAEMGRTGGGVFNTTARSGSNQWHGSGFFQTRPVWGTALNFFNDVAGRSKKETGLADSFYRLWGGGFGGPIKHNKTFFWTATEGYRSRVTRNRRYIWPSLNQRKGDFSSSTINGVPVRLFNPWCRDGVVNARCPAVGTGSLATGGEFTGAIIPQGHPAASQVGFNLVNAYPTEHIQGPMASNEDNQPNVTATANLNDEADMWTLKMEHKFSDTVSLSGLYIYNNTDEPGNIVMPESHAFMDDDHWILRRRPHVLVFNNVNILNDTTVLTMRYGWTTWQDQVDFFEWPGGPAGAGFSQNFLSLLGPDGVKDFPDINFDDVRDVNGPGYNTRRWNAPYAVNAALSKLFGDHSVKLGFDVRRLGITTTTENDMAGQFDFTSGFTEGPGGVGGHELASLLLGLPRTGALPINRGQGEWYTRYWGGYVQDDWRVNSRFTLNFGIRLEHEQGLQEVNNQQTVAFDTSAVNPLDALVPKTGLLAGRTLNGGLVYAGVGGAPTEQGDPPTVKASPRVGATYSLNDETVVRAGYGLFYAPWNYSATQHGQIGFSRRTALNQSSDTSEVPITTLADPFPNGLQPAIGSSLGLLTGAGGTINYIDQNKGAPRVHQYSVDLQRELPGNMAITVGYIGATGRALGFGGQNNTAININQIDPAVAAAAFPAAGGGWDANALRTSVPNPFFGIAEAGEFAGRATILQGQLLRPFPQFGNINRFEQTDGGKRQYNAAIIKLDKRIGAAGWGGRFSYTYSQTSDNQFGQSNTFLTRTATPQNNLDLAAEYGRSNFDSPHRVILAPIVRFPSPADDGGAAHWFLGGWTASAIVQFVSGPPLNAVLSGGTSAANLGLLGGRLRPNRIGDPNTAGSDTDRVSTSVNPNARWFNSGAFQTPPAGSFGSSSRVHNDARMQFRKNIDFVLAKDTRLGGGQTAQIRFELLNLTNTPKFGGANNATNLSSFGRVDDQRGFSRIWQITFRYSF